MATSKLSTFKVESDFSEEAASDVSNPFEDDEGLEEENQNATVLEKSMSKMRLEHHHLKTASHLHRSFSAQNILTVSKAPTSGLASEADSDSDNPTNPFEDEYHESEDNEEQHNPFEVEGVVIQPSFYDVLQGQAPAHSFRERAYSNPEAANSAVQDRKTWKSSVSESLFKNLSKEEVKRQEAIFELVQTEETFVKHLSIVVEHFYNAMLSFITKDERTIIFNNITSIFQLHQLILGDFLNKQEQDKMFIQSISSILLKHSKIMEDDSVNSKGSLNLLLYLEYCPKQMNASKFLQKKRTEDVRLGEFLKKTSGKFKNLDLSSFLLEPMQRIARYPLLLKQIIHYTPKTHPDHASLLKTLNHFELLLMKVNYFCQIEDSNDKLKDLNTKIHDLSLDLTSETRHLGPRIIVYEGDILKAKSGRKLHLFLFNDFLLFCEKIGTGYFKVYRKLLSLNEIKVQLASRGEDDPCFQIMTTEHELITLKAVDAKSRKTWMLKFEQAIKECILGSVKGQKGSAKAVLENKRSIYKMNTSIGTLNLNLEFVEVSDPPYENAYIVMKQTLLGDQRVVQAQRTNDFRLFTMVGRGKKKIDIRSNFMFSLSTFDDSMNFELFSYNKYAKDTIIAKAEINLTFLEYYGSKETELIELPFKDGNGKVAFRLNYRGF